jgi:peptide deformylase
MPQRTILQLGDARLWQPAAAVASPTAPELQALVHDLGDTLAGFREKHGFGRGIAAPQLGVLQRVIFIRMQPTGFRGPLINPEISWRSDDTFELWDDCFSLPNLMVRVSRHQRIRVNYQDGDGRPRELDAEGDFSELLQHEIDHLDGILATDRALSPRAFSTREEWLRGQGR